MATTKTLTPTNQAITLADFTEKPDNRTNVTNDDKLADAVNALNSNMATLTYTGTVDSLQTSLVSLASNMSVGEFRNIKYTAGEALAPFRNTRIYSGTFKRTGNNYWSVTLEDPEGVPVYGTYRNGRWSWEPLALDSKVKAVTLEKTVNNGYFTIDISTDIGSGYSIASINTVYKSGTTADQLNLCYTIDGNVVYVRTGSGNQLANGTVIKVFVVGIYI